MSALLIAEYQSFLRDHLKPKSYLSHEKARELATQLQSEEDDGTLYIIEERGKYSVIRLEESDGYVIGYL